MNSYEGTVNRYFIRPSRACKLLFLKAFCLLFGFGCAATPAPPPEFAGGFELTGKLSLTYGGKRDSVRFLWLQSPREDFSLEVWGPLGQGRVRLIGSAGELAIVDAQGTTLSRGAPEAVMQAHLGWVLPLFAFRHWVQGVPDPTRAARQEERDAQGRRVAFRQWGWQVRYPRYREVPDDGESRWLPALVTAEHADYEVRMALSRWRITL